MLFQSFSKISGRYWLNDNFDIDLYDNDDSVVRLINDDINNGFTCYYKLSNKDSLLWFKYLLNSNDDFNNCIGFEVMFANFLKTVKKQQQFTNGSFVAIQEQIFLKWL